MCSTVRWFNSDQRLERESFFKVYLQLLQDIRKGKFSQNLFLQAPRRLLVDLVEVQELVKTAALNLGELHKGPCAKG